MTDPQNLVILIALLNALAGLFMFGLATIMLVMWREILRTRDRLHSVEGNVSIIQGVFQSWRENPPWRPRSSA